MNLSKNRYFLYLLAFLTLAILQSCSSFKQRTYDEEANKDIEDPEPVYDITLDRNYQDFTTYMFMGNRIENFSTYFNTYFNATENFDDAYDDYVTRVLSVYSEHLDSIFIKPPLSQEAKDKFNTSIEKASKIIQYHKSSQFMDRSVLLVGKAYYYLGDYLKAERKFSEFLSKLPVSSLYDEAILYLARTQLRLDNIKSATEKLDQLIAKSKQSEILSGAYQSKAEYYLYIKDLDNAIKNFKEAIKYSTDSEFKAQMQFIVATVTERTDNKQAASEYDKVLDYGVSFDLEYLAKFNYTKSLIANNQFSKSSDELENLEVKYKDLNQYLGEVNYLKGTYYEQKKDIRKSIDQYYYTIQNFPQTKPSSDAAYRIALYEENVKKDLLSAYKYYRYSIEQSSTGTNNITAGEKAKIFKRYFELKSDISGIVISTDYDSTFLKKVSNVSLEKQNEQLENPSKDFGKPGGMSDSLEETKKDDSVKIRQQKVSQAKYELAELFLYDLNMSDSGEYYFKDAFEGSDDYEFKAKVLFALANLYSGINKNERSEEILRQILQDYPSSAVVIPSKRLLNIPTAEETVPDLADSLYVTSENKFLSKDYLSAIDGFKTILVQHPSSRYSEKCLYGTGWIYENILLKPDSAFYYYSSLVKSSPSSELARVVLPKIDEYNSFYQKQSDTNKTEIINDSMKINENTPKEKEEPLIKNGADEKDKNPDLKTIDPIKDEKKESYENRK